MQLHEALYLSLLVAGLLSLHTDPGRATHQTILLQSTICVCQTQLQAPSNLSLVVVAFPSLQLVPDIAGPSSIPLQSNVHCCIHIQLQELVNVSLLVEEFPSSHVVHGSADPHGISSQSICMGNPSQLHAFVNVSCIVSAFQSLQVVHGIAGPPSTPLQSKEVSGDSTRHKSSFDKSASHTLQLSQNGSGSASHAHQPLHFGNTQELSLLVAEAL
jgi:hypothetical protein